jgi:hypothetical protein
MKMMKRVFAVAIALGAASVFPACGSRAGDVCKSFCDCEGCSDNQHQACMDTFEEVREAYDKYGCGSKYDDWMQCSLDRQTCTAGVWGPRGTDCSGEAKILSDCRTAGSSLK